MLGRLDDIPLLCRSLDIIKAKLNTDELYESTAVHFRLWGQGDWLGGCSAEYTSDVENWPPNVTWRLCANNLKKCQHLLSGNESNTYALITHAAVLGPNHCARSLQSSSFPA
jgi:hypothetical protein